MGNKTVKVKALALTNRPYGAVAANHREALSLCVGV